MTSTKITLAQLSDLHLPFPNWPELGQWNFKRSLGLLNWHRKRKFVHKFEAVHLIVEDLQKQNPDHIAVTGDLVNLGLPQEFKAARRWLKNLGDPDRVSVIPGNHDIYCPLEEQDDCRTIWSDYMKSDAFGLDSGVAKGAAFPLARKLGSLVLVGVNSAVPTPPGIARGLIGEAQRNALSALLGDIADLGLRTCVMVHHPPLPNQAPNQRALMDAEALQQLLSRQPVDLVIYGHNHRDAVTWLDKARAGAGKVLICGAASASAWRAYKSESLARYHLYTFKISGGEMEIERVTRGLHDNKSEIIEIDRLSWDARKASV